MTRANPEFYKINYHREGIEAKNINILNTTVY